jgi:hypothetical protein
MVLVLTFSENSFSQRQSQTMGQAALSGTTAEEALPDPVTEQKARDFVGNCFDDSDWMRITKYTSLQLNQYLQT